MRKLSLLAVIILGVVACQKEDQTLFVDEVQKVEANWRDFLTQVDGKESSSGRLGATYTEDLVTLGSVTQGGDYRLNYKFRMDSMTIDLVTTSGQTWSGSGFDSQNVTVLHDTKDVSTITFSGINPTDSGFLETVTIDVANYVRTGTHGSTLELAIEYPGRLYDVLAYRGGQTSFYVKHAATGVVLELNYVCTDDDNGAYYQDAYFTVTGAKQDGKEDIVLAGAQSPYVADAVWSGDRCGEAEHSNPLSLQDKILELAIESNATNFGPSIHIGSTPESAVVTPEELETVIDNGFYDFCYIKHIETGAIVKVTTFCEDYDNVFHVTGLPIDGSADVALASGGFSDVEWSGQACSPFEASAESYKSFQDGILYWVTYTNATNFGTEIPRPGSTIELAIEDGDILVAIAEAGAVGDQFYVKHTASGAIIRLTNLEPTDRATYFTTDVNDLTGASDISNDKDRSNNWGLVDWTTTRVTARGVFNPGSFQQTIATLLKAGAYNYGTPISSLPGNVVQNPITSGSALVAAMQLELYDNFYVEQVSTGAILRLERVCGAVVHVTGTSTDGSQDLVVNSGTGELSGITWLDGRCGSSHNLWGDESLQTQIGGYLEWTHAFNFGTQVRRAIYPHDGSTAAKAVETFAEFEANKDRDRIHVRDTESGSVIVFASICSNDPALYTYSVEGATEGAREFDNLNTKFDFNGNYVQNVISFTPYSIFNSCEGNYSLSSNMFYGTEGLQRRVRELLSNSNPTNWGHLSRDGSSLNRAIQTSAELSSYAPQPGEVVYVEDVTTGDIIAFRGICNRVNDQWIVDALGAPRVDALLDRNEQRYALVIQWNGGDTARDNCDGVYTFQSYVHGDAGVRAIIQAYIQHTDAMNFRY